MPVGPGGLTPKAGILGPGGRAPGTPFAVGAGKPTQAELASLALKKTFTLLPPTLLCFASMRRCLRAKFLALVRTHTLQKSSH